MVIVYNNKRNKKPVMSFYSKCAARRYFNEAIRSTEGNEQRRMCRCLDDLEDSTSPDVELYLYEI